MTKGKKRDKNRTDYDKLRVATRPKIVIEDPALTRTKGSHIYRDGEVVGFYNSVGVLMKDGRTHRFDKKGQEGNLFFIGQVADANVVSNGKDVPHLPNVWDVDDETVTVH